MPSHTFTREVPSIPGVYWTDRSYAAQLCGVDHECSGQWIHPRGGYLNNLEGIGWFYGPLPTEMPNPEHEPCGDDCEYCRNNPVHEDYL
jgi:hypothetical protein